MISYAGYSYYAGHRGERKAQETIETLKTMIPGLGVDNDVVTGLGRDPLAYLSIDGVDIVGVIEIPSLDIMAPVMGQAQDDHLGGQGRKNVGLDTAAQAVGQDHDAGILIDIHDIDIVAAQLFTDMIDGLPAAFDIHGVIHY